MTKQEPKVDLKSDKRKQSVYFPVDMLDEIQREALRQDRTVSWDCPTRMENCSR